MYVAILILTMLVLPIVSIVIESLVAPGSGLTLLVGRWFVFWAIGVRVFLAGIRQVAQPSFTARTIFNITDKSAEKIVTEIGFGNLAMGFLALITILVPAWVMPAAIVRRPLSRPRRHQACLQHRPGPAPRPSPWPRTC